MTLKDIVIHVGYPKTGSTTIQRWLTDNPELLAASGVRYVRAGRIDRETGAVSSIQHVALFNELRGPKLSDPKAGELTAARAEIRTSKEPIALLSSEQFAVLNEPYMRRFANLLSRVAHRIRIVVYLRDQDRYLESLYNSRLVRADKPFLEDFDKLVAEQVEGQMLAYGARLKMFSEVVGDENLSVATFGGEATSGANLLRDFLPRVGCQPLPPIDEVPLQNASNDVRAVHVWRTLMRETPPEETEMVRRRMLGRLRALQSELGWGAERPVFFTPEARRALLGRYLDENAEVNARYGTELTTAETIDARESPPSNWPPVGLFSEADISAVRDAFGLDLSGAVA